MLWSMEAETGRNLLISGRMRIRNYGLLRIGDSVRINSGPSRNIVGGDRKTNLFVGPNGTLEIEDGVGISNSTIVAMDSVRILSGSMIGGGCDIYDYDFHELSPDERSSRSGNIGAKPIVIGPNAFVGAHSIILKGVKIGNGSVIGAGSLVTRDVPDMEIWGGRPAQFIRKVIAQTE